MVDIAIEKYGAHIRKMWPLAEGFLTVNHGAYGAAPNVVLAEQDRWRRLLEKQPTYFMQRILPDALEQSRRRLAAFVGADDANLVFVDNATTGVNAVLNSLSLQPTDVIATTQYAYGAVRKALDFHASRSGGSFQLIKTPFPLRAGVNLAESIVACLAADTRLLVVDHITSPTALELPIESIVRGCRDRGIPVLVDGAHAPAHIDVDLESLSADWYVGNCHKWLMAPKGSAFLWTHPSKQALTHPTTISHGYREGYLAEFAWTGTRDPTPFLCVPAAIDFHFELGGERLRDRNKALAWEAATLIAEAFDTEVGVDKEHACAMVTVRLPVSPSQITAADLRSGLLDLGTDAPVFQHGEALWLRISSQAYNDRDDYRMLERLIHKALGDAGVRG
ncbi:aminotransferase class V-fold PLP-dependent enzyme (plasmid) [Sinorhizobium meliloti]|uniref:aminotransferase class V-fold PLP-dependent enzyme n=1 Tax=Rhizobium meliloti TaxID=382 RepID=UPI000B497CA8|nr:aminotransferase class V-fold PLP-dependent enzyme [Sinorhizobium meliloti]ASP89694.1 aminotransferase class V-fold PLP-dependent enzyme [Sinorhizobium meliloti]MQW25540.1 aminotransferase class V-fold PLP-dependent enzyme [Sinorhizobium meliloti]